MNSEQSTSLEKLTSLLQGCGMGIPLSRFVDLNRQVFQEFKKFRVPQKKQAEIVSVALGKAVSVSSLAVALSRTSGHHGEEKEVKLVKKDAHGRFKSKDAKLTLGGQYGQTEEVQIIRNGVVVGTKELVIDWRALAPGESLSSWILDYKPYLIALNEEGWRWTQIADALNDHFGKPKKLSANTLTSVISLSNKKKPSN